MTRLDIVQALPPSLRGEGWELMTNIPDNLQGDDLLRYFRVAMRNRRRTEARRARTERYAVRQRVIQEHGVSIRHQTYNPETIIRARVRAARQRERREEQQIDQHREWLRAMQQHFGVTTT